MVDRSVSVALRATITSYLASMRTAASATRQFGTTARTAGAQASAGFASATASAERTAASATATQTAMARTAASARTSQSAMSRLGTGVGREASNAAGSIGRLSEGMLGLGAVAAIGIGGAVKASMDFDKAMSAVRANITATPAQFEALSKQVRNVGTEYGYTATESAAATEELAKAGLSTADIMGGALTGALTLAAAGGVSAGEAAETAATAMSMFGLKAADVGHIADVLANGANQSTASVGSLSQALAQGGGAAASFGLTLEDTVATLAMFDQNGLKGSDAGTSLKTMLMSLANPSAKARVEMQSLGIVTEDASGKFIGMAGLQDQLKTRMKDLTQTQRNQALATIFGSDAMRAANVLFRDTRGFDAWKDGVSKSGTAAENARTRLNNLAGDLQKLKATMLNTAISVGGALAPALRSITQGVTGAVKSLGTLADGVAKVSSIGGNAFGQIPQGAQTAALAFGALAVASRTFSGTFATANARMASAGASMRTFASSIRTVPSSLASGASSLRAFSQASGAIVNTNRGMAVSMGRFGTSVAQIGRSVPAVARMQQAFVSAAAGAERFPRAAGTAAASMSALKTAGSGALSVIGGPFGAALLVAGVALTAWQSHQQAAARAAAEHKAQVEALTSAVKADGGALGDATKQQIVDNLIKADAISTAKDYGVSISTITQAAMGNKQAQQDLNSGLIRGTDASYQAAMGYATMDDRAKKLYKTVTGIAGSTGKSLSLDNQRNAAMRAAGSAYLSTGQAASAYANAAKDVANAQTAAAKASDQLRKGIDGVNNEFLQAEASSDAFQAAIDAATSSMEENGRSLDANTEKGRANRSALRDVVSTGMQYADSLAKQGASATTVASQVMKTRQAYITAATAMGMSRKEATALAEKYAAMPSKVTTKIEADITLAKANLQAAQAATEKYGVVLSTLPKSVQTKIIQSGGANAKTEINKVKDAAKQVPGNVFVRSSAPNAVATTGQLNRLSVAAVTADGKTVFIPASSPGAADSINKLLRMKGAAVSADAKTVTIPSHTPLADATIAKLKNISGVAVSADGKSVSINTSAPGAAAAAQQILSAGSAADSVNGKRAVISIITKKTTVTSNDGSRSLNLGLADGAVLNAGRHSVAPKAMADGGIERAAQIQSRPILWAEAGPEAYIPLGSQRRTAPRTQQIFKATADVLGYEVTKRAADGYYSGTAWPQTTVQTVAVGGGLSNADRALMRENIRSNQQVMAAMPGAITTGMDGRDRRSGQRDYVASRLGITL